MITKNNKKYTGRVDGSLPCWSMDGGVVLVDGRQVAECRPENLAQAGFDIRLVTRVDPAIAGRVPARFRGSLLGDRLLEVADWVQRHPEVWADSRPARRYTPTKRALIRLHSRARFLDRAKYITGAEWNPRNAARVPEVAEKLRRESLESIRQAG